MPVSVFLAVPVRLYRDGLRAVLEKRNEINVVGECGDLSEAVDGVITSAASVAVVDVAHPRAAPLIRGLRTRAPGLRILAFAVEERLATVLSYAEAGAHGFFSANGSIDDLVIAVVKVAQGEMICSPKVASELLAQCANLSLPVARHNSLTSREREVFQFMQRGCSNKEIAKALSISGATVKNHVHHMFEKMQVKTRTQALARYGAAGSHDPGA
jgi:DNA-binding NarL/FixJ family response regulator